MLHNSCNRVLERACDGSAVIVEVHIPLSLKRIWPSVCDKLQLCENACIRESDPENLRLTCVDLYSMCCIESSVSMSLCVIVIPWYIRMLHNLLSIQQLCWDSTFIRQNLCDSQIFMNSLKLFYNIDISALLMLFKSYCIFPIPSCAQVIIHVGFCCYVSK